jgi:predicted deacylase
MFDTQPSEDAFNLLKEHIEEHDVVIDIHSSPSCTEFALIDIDEYTSSMRKWCEAAKVQVACRYSGANTIKRYCLEKGKAALTLELNSLHTVDHISAREGVEMIRRLIETSSEYANATKDGPLATLMAEIQCFTPGVVEFHLENGESFERGDTMFEIVDLEGKSLYSHNAPFDGVVICEPSRHFVNRGEIILLVQPKMEPLIK